jgi:hypothetical protein
MRVALVRRVILREDHAVRWPFKVAADPPTGQEAKPFGVRIYREKDPPTSGYGPNASSTFPQAEMSGCTRWKAPPNQQVERGQLCPPSMAAGADMPLPECLDSFRTKRIARRPAVGKAVCTGTRDGLVGFNFQRFLFRSKPPCLKCSAMRSSPRILGTRAPGQSYWVAGSR